jgi:hypothetical protein
VAWTALTPGLVDRAPRDRRRLRAGHQYTTDFTFLLGRESLHAGLVCLNVAPGLMSLGVQKLLFSLVLDRLGDIEPVNEIIEVTLSEDRSVLVQRYDFPPGK